MLNPEYKNLNQDLWTGTDWSEEERQKTLAKNEQVERGLTGIPVIDAANELVRKINLDPLTEAMNCAYYIAFKEILFKPERDKNKIGLIFIDVDKLKTINDSLGHSVGDQALKEVVDYLKSKFRHSDEICRKGGDEFIIICHNDQNDQNFEENLLEKMKTVVADRPKSMIANFSYGVAVYGDGDQNLDDTQKRADKLMYINKAQNRRQNRT